MEQKEQKEMNEVKKWKEYLGLIVFFVPLIFAIFKYTNSYMDIPDNVAELQKDVAAMKEKNRKQDSTLVVHTEFLKQDYQIFINNGMAK